MIFRPKLAALVLAKKKTQTRVVVKPDELECRYKPGKDYAVQAGHATKSIGRLHVLAVGRERVGDITDDDVQAEGFTDRQEFLAYFWDTNGGFDPWVSPFLEVWVITFRVSLPYAPPTLLGKTGGYVPIGGMGGVHVDVERNGLATVESMPEPEGVPPELVAHLSSNAQKRWNREQLLEHQARAAATPAEQLADELDAIRRESPADAPFYEAKAAKLADQIRKKRLRVAA